MIHKVTMKLRHIKSEYYYLVFSSTGEHSECSKSCGDGTKTRARTCIGGICSRATSEDLIETVVCNEGDCKFSSLIV